MAQLFEDSYPISVQGGLRTNLPTTLGGTLAVTGVATFAVAPVFTAGLTRVVNQSALVGATVVLAASDSNSININRSTSGSPSWTLPPPANGLAFTFICANTTAGFTITSSAAVIHAKTSATGTAITSTTTITNTQGTAVVGDHLSIVCDGTTWWPTSQSGIFAAS